MNVLVVAGQVPQHFSVSGLTWRNVLVVAGGGGSNSQVWVVAEVQLQTDINFMQVQTIFNINQSYTVAQGSGGGQGHHGCLLCR